MHKCEVELKNETGLHARPANLFIQLATKFKSDIKLLKDEKEFNGKSIISVLSMGAGKGSKITIIAEGEDENQAVDALKELINGNFEM